MGIWIAAPQLRDDEKIRWKWPANRKQAGRAIGGQLTITTERLLFQPHRLDRLTGGKSWECPLRAVNDVSALERGDDVFAGGMRKRLEVRTEGLREVFVVNRLEEKIALLKQLTSQAGD